MSIINTYWKAAKGAGLLTAGVMTCVGKVLGKRDQAVDNLLGRAASGEEAKRLLIESGVYYENPMERRIKKMETDTTAIRDLCLSQLYQDDEGNFFINDDAFQIIVDFANHQGLQIKKYPEDCYIPLNKAFIAIYKTAKDNPQQLVFKKILSLALISRKAGGFRPQFLIK